jgi:plasmid stabilization system protein ParE
MGLIRGIARTAVVAGTATAVSNRVSRRQQARWTEKEQAEAAPVAATDDLSAQLDRLGSMRQSGQLSDEEFAAAKAKLLGI